jgi:arginine repressor
MKVEGLVGTLAGHDTGFLALKDTAAAEHLYSEIKELF